MRKWLLEMGTTAGWLAIGAVVALTILVAKDVDRAAEANHWGKAWLQSGLYFHSPLWCSNWSSYPAPRHLCWHPAMNGTATAIDYNVGSGPSDDVGKRVLLYTTGGNQHWKTVSLTYCKGMEARIYDTFAGNETYFRGQVRYLHIDPYGPHNGYVFTGYVLDVGRVHGGPEISGCGWTGPHLHQDAKVTSSTPFWTNWYGNHPFTHSHTICWGSPCP